MHPAHVCHLCVCGILLQSGFLERLGWFCWRKPTVTALLLSMTHSSCYQLKGNYVECFVLWCTNPSWPWKKTKKQLTISQSTLILSNKREICRTFCCLMYIHFHYYPSCQVAYRAATKLIHPCLSLASLWMVPHLCFMFFISASMFNVQSSVKCSSVHSGFWVFTCSQHRQPVQIMFWKLQARLSTKTIQVKHYVHVILGSKSRTSIYLYTHNLSHCFVLAVK